MSRHDIMTEIETELNYQEHKWGHTTDDTQNAPFNWVAYIANYSTKWMAGLFPPFNKDVVDDFRTCMIKVASIAISAVESIDRQRANNGKTFYEQ